MKKSNNYSRNLRGKMNNNWTVIKYFTQNNIPLVYKCNAGHTFSATKHKFSRNQYCPICKIAKTLKRPSKIYQAFLHEVENVIEKKCVLTGSEENLDLHHLYSIRMYPDLATNLDNVIYLSKDLHIDYHKVFSPFNTTGFSFLSWLEKKKANESYEFKKTDVIKLIKTKIPLLEDKIREVRNHQNTNNTKLDMTSIRTQFFENEIINKSIEIIEEYTKESYVEIEIGENISITNIRIEPEINYINNYSNWTVYNAMSAYIPRYVYDIVMNFKIYDK